MKARKSVKTLGCVFIFLASTILHVAAQTGPELNDRADLFESEEVLDLILEGNLRDLMRDRGDDPSYHPMTLRYKNVSSDTKSLDLRVRVRGNFRRLRENCKNPPIKFNFKKHEVPESSIFSSHPELKVVMPCKGEEYVIREYLVYKLYNLFTDYSFRARLIRLTYRDTERNDESDPEYGFLIEDQDVMAARNNAVLYERNNLRPETLKQEHFFRMSVFAYMMGNTDWSIEFQHNVKLLFQEEEKYFVAVPYDFDLVGMVSSPYAEPAEALELRSVRERLYRGYCLDDLSMLDPVFEEFRRLKPAIYNTFQASELVDNDYKEFATDYIDEFYEVINSPKKRSRAFSSPCTRNGKGDVIISGMNNG